MKISANAIKLSFKRSNILKGIDFELHDKEFLGIIGPNGSGKSTLLKCIYRILKPDSGVIYLDGRMLDEFSYRETALKMAVVAQHSNYNFDFTVLSIVLMGRTPYKKLLDGDSTEDIDIACSALKKVGLSGMEDRLFSTLSGGEQQRVILARALTQDTECLLLDEPTNHLDIKYQLQIMDVAKTTRKTVIAVIHDLNIAAMYCDRIIVMNEGEIVALGTPKDVLTVERIYELYGVRSLVTNKPWGIQIQFLPSIYNVS